MAGQYNERAFQALDYVLDQAAKFNVRLLLSFGDNWGDVDSKAAVRLMLLD